MVRLHKCLKVSLFLFLFRVSFLMEGCEAGSISGFGQLDQTLLRLPPLIFVVTCSRSCLSLRVFREIIPFSLHSNFISRIYGISNFRNGQTFFSVDSLRNRTTIGIVDSLIQRLREHSHHCDLIRISVSWDHSVYNLPDIIAEKLCKSKNLCTKTLK